MEVTTRSRFKDYLFIMILGIVFITFGLINTGVKESFEGLIRILTTPDGLITDFFVQGNIGGAFLNSGLLLIIATLLFLVFKKDMSGQVLASLFLFGGFALFGKNLINVWPIIIGVFIFSLIKKEDFKDLIATALMGCTMAPAVSEVLFYPGLNLGVAVIASLSLGIFIGLVLPLVSRVAFNFHDGFNLYNIGFTGGIILTVVVSILKVFGFNVKTRELWSTGNNELFAWFLIIIFIALIIYGFTCEKEIKKKLKQITISTGAAPSDFYTNYGRGATLVNMGLLGILAVIFILIVGASLNGPTIGGVLTIVGFGAAGKHIRSVSYILFGALLGQIFHMWDLTQPMIILGALFATGLSPIAGAYGPIFGMMAAIVHISVVQNTGELHFGLNLYNNGFAEGMVALFMNGFVKILGFKHQTDSLIRKIVEKEEGIR